MKAYPRGLPESKHEYRSSTKKPLKNHNARVVEKQGAETAVTVQSAQAKVGTCCILHHPYPLDRTILLKLTLQFLLGCLKTNAGNK